MAHAFLQGNSKYVVLYDVREGEGVMVKKFQISENLSLDGTEQFLHSRRINDAGINVDLTNNRDGSDLEEGWTRVFLELVEVLEICPFDASDKRPVQNVFDFRRRVRSLD